jgi:DNA-binding GntR family transcriptional regulator
VQPALIDRAYERLAEAIADGTLAPGRRIRQKELGGALGISRQPISHALQWLKQQKLVEENGRRGLIVSENRCRQGAGTLLGPQRARRAGSTARRRAHRRRRRNRAPAEQVVPVNWRKPRCR